MRPRFGLLLTAAGLCFSAMAASAAAGGARDAVGEAFRISPPAATANESDVRLAYGASADGFLAVWCDSRGPGDGREIYGRFLAGDGSRRQGIHISDRDATGWEQHPAVAANTDTGEYLVVWQDSRNPDPEDPLESDIYGRLVSAAGVPLGGGLPIGTGKGEAWEPAVAYNPGTGGYLVVWRLWMPGSRDIYGRALDSAGAPVGEAFLISTKGGATGSVEVAYSPIADRFLVVWGRYESGYHVIRGRGVSGAGEVVGAEFRIGSSWDPDVAYDPATDRFLVVWALHRPTREPRLYGRLVTGAGVPAGEEFRISPPIAEEETEPAVAYDSSLGRFLVVWQDARGPGRWSVWGRQVSGTGETPAGDFRIGNPVIVSGGPNPAVAFGAGEGQFLVAWMDARWYATRGWDIRGRLAEG